MAEFVEILQSFEIEWLIDVRRYPGSRRSSHFNKENLINFMPEYGMKYHHMEDLGGEERLVRSRINSGWRLLSFRGYADYMENY